jgi:PAS domain S-box-containing protein/putative nucleotidyltransferase with HDIG domain
MLWQWSLSVIAELAVTAILLVLAIYFPWRDLNRQARLTGVTLVLFCALWILAHAIEIGLPVVSYKESLVGLQLVLGIMALTFWLFYIFHYLGPRNSLTWRIYILFGIMPLIAILALSTNNVYGLMWTEVGIDSQNPYLPLQPTYGIIYWACMVYIAILTLTGSFLIIWNIIRRKYSYRRESIYLLIAAVLPLITAFIEVLGLLSFLKLSVGLSSWIASIGAIILILNLPKFHLEQVIPIARDIIFERIGDCILVLDVQNRVLDLNPAAEHLTGYRIADAFGLPIERIWPYHTASLMPFNKMADTGEELVLERDGTQRDYNLRISSINDAGGILTSKVVLLTDITELKKGNEALRREQIMLARTEGIANIGSWEWDIATDTVTWSDELFRIFQRDPEEGAPSFAEHPAFYHTDDMARLQQAVEAAIANGAPYELELRAIRKDGETRVCMARGVAEMALDGRPVRLFGSLQDITNRKQTEVALQDSEVRFRELFNRMSSGVVAYEAINNGEDFVIRDFNPAAENIEKVSRKDILGKCVSEVFTGVKSFGIFEILQRVWQTGKPEFFPEAIYKDERDPGSWRESWIFKLPTNEIVAVYNDITERKLSEAKLKKSYESLQKTLDDAINTMAKIVETRDPYTAGHQHRVADLANAIAREMKLEDTRIDQLTTAAVVHDIGKMYVPSDILSKPGILSDIEFSLIKTHPQYGYDIVKGMDFPCNVAKAVLQHHERLDGSGYPNHLKGEDTLLEAKILAVADVIEAMASHRPYRPALGINKALEEISKNRGKIYDPDVVDACLKLFQKEGFKFTQAVL